MSMNAPWQFYNPVDLTIGRDCRAGLAQKLGTQPKTLLLVTSQRGRQQWESDSLLQQIAQSHRLEWHDRVTENPDLHELQDSIEEWQGHSLDAVIAFGGGSAMDAAKAMRSGLSCDMPLADQLASPQLATRRVSLPLYALPTTAGTGSEVTPFATVWDHQAKKKHSLAGRRVFPTAAFVDGALMDSLPSHVTISTGLDAINQAAESIWNRHANPLTLNLATQALQLGMETLPRLASGESTSDDRDRMAEASTLAGLAISQTRTALCHAMSYPLTAHYGVPHGLACAFTMPAVLAHNLTADDGRFTQLAHALGHTTTAALLTYFEALNERLNVREMVKRQLPSLEALLSLQSEMHTPGRADNNLAPITALSGILRSAWGESGV
ncbi:phosphonoacetaldehyde reductase [Vreelandella aquamarina]|uniref:phosphonoacetaldehyde reductase n=1 Tax=Vreelandella aquamarina TaxID=77097 RepID=UPI00384E1636